MDYNELERKKYNNAWADPRYTGTNQEAFLNWIGRDDFSHIIDFGCGKAQIRDHLMYTLYTGIDISDKVIIHNLKNAPVEDSFFCFPLDQFGFTQAETKAMHKSFTGLCTDVMEHIGVEHLDGVLKNMSQHCKECYFTIALFPHRYNGEELHLSILQPEEWERIIDRYFKIQRVETLKSTHLYLKAKSR